MNTQLTSNDINQLLEALTAWEKEPGRNGLQDVMFSSLLGGFGPEETREERMSKSKMDAERKMKQTAQDEKLRREQSVLLQAKLIMLRQECFKAELQMNES